MYTPLPQTSEAFARLGWPEIACWYNELKETPLSEETLQPWLLQWSRLSELVDETLAAFEIACTRNTLDKECGERQEHFLNDIYVRIQPCDQQIKQQLLESDLKPEGFEIPMRNIRMEIANFCESNVTLINEEKKLIAEYMQVGGAQTVMWEGKEVHLQALSTALAEPERAIREQAWRSTHRRLLADRDIRNEQWANLLKLRLQMARNAGYETYRDYRWQQMMRFDYTPADCQAFHALVEREVVPVSNALWEKRRQALGVEVLRPWDQKVDARASVAPRQISDVPALLQRCASAFHRIDPHLGSYFDIMVQENLLDLEARPHKAPVGYNIALEARHRPFILGHISSVRDVIPLVFHESGHAFHVFEMAPLPFIHQRKDGVLPTEFAEVASTSMELIGLMHLHASGLCTREEEIQVRMQHLEYILMDFIPNIVRTDVFQHWIYENPEQAADPDALDQKWAELSGSYLSAIDWSGLDAELHVGWQRVLHLYYYPFYLLEYIFATIGALQIWSNYRRDPQTTLQQYRFALSLGATRTVPELYAAAGAKFALDASTLRSLVQLIMQTLEELEKQL